MNTTGISRATNTPWLDTCLLQTFGSLGGTRLLAVHHDYSADEGNTGQHADT